MRSVLFLLQISWFVKMISSTCVFENLILQTLTLFSLLIIKFCSGININITFLTNCDIKSKNLCNFNGNNLLDKVSFLHSVDRYLYYKLFQRSNSPICPPLAVCGNVFEFDRMMDDGSVEPERRHITNCFCNNSRVCPFNRENMIYQSRTQQSVYSMASFNWWLYLISTYCIRNCTYLNLWKTIGEHFSSLIDKTLTSVMNLYACIMYLALFVWHE